MRIVLLCITLCSLGLSLDKPIGPAFETAESGSDSPKSDDCNCTCSAEPDSQVVVCQPVEIEQK